MKGDCKYPLFILTAGFLAVPLLVRDPFILNSLILAHVYAIHVLGWDFLAGVSGQISGGHALSFGSAAYLSAFFGLAGLTPPVIFPLAVTCTALIGLGVGMICCRQTGAYLILITLALAEIAHELSLNLALPNSRGYMLGGEGGLPVATLFEKGNIGFYLCNYYWTFIILLICMIGLSCLSRSMVGLKLRGVGCDPMAAQSIGLSPCRHRAVAFCLSFIPGGVAGALYAQYMGMAAPSTLSLELSFAAMAMAVVGGKGTIIGPAAAAYLLTALFSWFWVPPAARLLLYSLTLILAARLAHARRVRLLSGLFRPAGRG